MNLDVALGQRYGIAQHHAGLVRQAPPALQKVGLEWAFRLAMEPRRLAKRYFKHSPRFVWQLGRQLLRER